MADAATRRWLVASLTATFVPVVALTVFAPPDGSSPGFAFGVLLFVASSVHVASTVWFYTVVEVRSHVVSHPARYIHAPLALIAVGAIAALVLPGRALATVLLAFFGWQFFHFQKQNLGVVALIASALGSGSLTIRERHALTATGVGGILGICGQPHLLQLARVPRLPWVHWAGLGILVAGCVLGGSALAQRSWRPFPFAGAYSAGLLFFLPVWLVSSPYAAIAGLTIAHGLQYLLLVGLIAGAPSAGRSVTLLSLVNVALVVGLALNQMAHLHGGAAVERVLFGVYLGVSAAHFVVDAGLWRLRDTFPRQFLASRLPYLFPPQRLRN